MRAGRKWGGRACACAFGGEVCEGRGHARWDTQRERDEVVWRHRDGRERGERCAVESLSRSG
jgi:hypothetical protein